jgi:hypothetical protein
MMLPRSRLCSLLTAAIVLLIAAFPGVAWAQSATNPLSPGLPQSPTTTPTATTPAAPPTTTPSITNSGSTSSGGSFTGTDAIVIAAGAIIVLGGISFFIWRDARRRAPLRHRAAAATAGAGGRSRSGSKAPAKARKLSPAERRRRKRGRAR